MYPYLEGAVLYKTPLGPRMFLVLRDTKLKINEHVWRILSFCDGMHEEDDVIARIAEDTKVTLEEAEDSYRKAVKILSDKGILKFRETSHPHPLKYRSKILEPPFEVAYLELTHRCNLKCKHCYNAAGITDELSTEEWKEILDEIHRCGCLRVHLTGGEPLLHRGFFDIVEYARSKLMVVRVLSNGTLLDEHAAEKMKKAGVSMLNLSVDGPNHSIHDEFRGVEGSFERTMHAIKAGLNSGIHVRVTICIHRRNLTEGKNLVHLMEKMGVTDYSFSPVAKSFREKDRSITPEEYKTFMRKLRKKEKIAVYAPQYVRNCGIGYKECVIHPDGTVGLCPPFGAEGPVIGDLKKDRFDTVWGSPIFEKLRSIDVFQDEKCGKCPHVGYCLGGCMATASYSKGVITCGNPYACAYYSTFSESQITVHEIGETL